ncbi:MAG: flagellar biosynthesis protein FlgH [Gallionella sp.]|nr:flagellar biosynthesis protein FlgH [Gallionella sp.]
MSDMFKQVLLGALVVLAGCSMTPPTRIQQPMSAKPPAKILAATSDGGIFHAGVNERPLFEDQRARNVGDILTISLVEQTSGSRQASGGTTSASSANSSTPSITRGAASLLNPFSINGNSKNSSANTGVGAATESLTGTITATVIEVLENGNLLVSGEKQVALNQSDEFIRFSGVVNPVTINNNVVLSTQVADVHLEFKNAGAMSEVMNDTRSLGFLGRFFKSVLPF